MINKIFTFLYLKLSFCLLTFTNFFIPKNPTYIYFSDYYLKKDNSWSLMEYLVNEEEYSTYTIIYHISDKFLVDEYIEKNIYNIKFVDNRFKAIYYKMRSNYIFYSYRSDKVAHFKSSRNQKIVDLMHGSPLKNIGYLSSNSKYKFLWNYQKNFDYILCQSDLFKVVIKQAFGATENQCIIAGYPRNDILFKEPASLLKLEIDKKKFNKIIFWMPTWRRNTDNKINSESAVEFPILNGNNIEKLDKILEREKIYLLIKPHPFQSKIELFKRSYSNIRIIDNSVLNYYNVELYGILSEVDALLTDYSSVYFDFLLKDKPIGFTIDDFGSYNEKRGFVVKNPLDLMPGNKIYNFEQLVSFIVNLEFDDKLFKLERERVRLLTNQYNDCESSKRIMEYLINDKYK